MSRIKLLKAPTDWTQEPCQTQVVSSLEADAASGLLHFTGYLGALADEFRSNGLKFSLQIAATRDAFGVLQFRAKTTVGHGAAAFTTKLPITFKCYGLLYTFCTDDLAHVLDPVVERVDILHGAPNSWLPTFP